MIHYVAVAFAVSQHLQQRLTEVIDDLRDAVESEAVKAYLTCVSVEPVKLKPGAELCNDSWMKVIDKDCMTDASEALCLTLSCSFRKSEPSSLQVTDLQTEANIHSSALLSQIISYLSSGKSSTTDHCEHCQKSKKKHKKKV